MPAAVDLVLSHNVMLNIKNIRVLVWISSDNSKATAQKAHKVIRADSHYGF